MGVQAAEWAIGLSTYLTGRLVELANAHVSENETERNWKRVEDIIRRAGVISGNDLHNKTRFLKAHERKSMVMEMVEKGLVTKAQNPPGRGRPGAVYMWNRENTDIAG